MVKNMQTDFISLLKWTARAQKNGFSSLSSSDQTTNDKFGGHTLKYGGQLVWAQPIEDIADKPHSIVWLTIGLAFGIFCLHENILS